MFHIYSSSQREDKFNIIYGREFEIDNEKLFAEAVSYDYVCAKFKDNRRSNINFICSDCIAMDIDNDYSDNPQEWITSERIAEFFQNVEFAVHYSRNHMKSKDGKSARPKFHVLFPINEVTKADEYSAMKKAVFNQFPHFDNNALDAGRFFFGTANPEVEFFSGSITLDIFLAGITKPQIIHQGQRNNTMHDIACKLVTRYGDKNEAYKLFIEHSKNCQPPLSDNELKNIWNGAVKSYKTNVLTDENYITPEIFNLTLTLNPDDYSDIGQAKILAREYKDKLRYCEIGTFLVYENGCWHESEVRGQGLAQDLTDRQLKEAENLIETIQAKIKDSGTQNIIDNAKKSCASNLLNSGQELLLSKLQQAEEYKKFVMQRRDVRFINSSLSAVKPMISVKPDELDSNEFDLNTPAGTYDLRVGLQGLRDHDPKDLITKITAVAPSDIGMDIWLDFLNTIFQSDKSLIDFVQDTIGLAAIGKVYNENIIIAYGNGCNGKSTFYNVISNVLGNYSGTISSESLTAGYRGNSNAERAEMKGKRIIIASELEEGKRLNTATLKQLCSTDKIHAERKFEAPFEFTPSHSLVLYTNYKPEISANDIGTWRRIIVIPFKAQITSKQDIKNYSDYLFKNAGGAILKWIIEGAYKIIRKDFKLTPSEVVINEINDYKADNDWFSDFIEQCCEIGQSYTASSKELYDTYCNYCNNRGLNIHSTTDFYSALENIECHRFKEKRIKMFSGIRLKKI